MPDERVDFNKKYKNWDEHSKYLSFWWNNWVRCRVFQKLWYSLKINIGYLLTMEESTLKGQEITERGF